MSSRKIKVMSVFGTRPEAIKMAPLVQELASRPEFESLCCLTGQHRQMLDSVMEIFHLKAQYDLDIMERQQTLSSITTKTLLGMERVLTEAEFWFTGTRPPPLPGPWRPSITRCPWAMWKPGFEPTIHIPPSRKK